ncbi:MAG: gliding motility-associated C-terminal domain-containing protein [Bacteroidia bacterium]|nr:gliding motility-associated C-terminal domain-containing protein [Bacteroidia bacterium]
MYNVITTQNRIENWTQTSSNNTPEWRSFVSDNISNSSCVVCYPFNFSNPNFNNPFLDDKYIVIGKDNGTPNGENLLTVLYSELVNGKKYKIRLIGQGILSGQASQYSPSGIEIHLTTPISNWFDQSELNKNMMSMMYCTQNEYVCKPRSFEAVFTATKNNLKQIVLQANHNFFYVDRVELYEYCTELLTRQGRIYKFDRELEEAETIIAGSVINNSPAMGEVAMLDGSITTYKASKEVKLTEGFYINRGADFTAKIAPCGQDCPTTNIDIPTQYVLCNNDCINLTSGIVSRGLTVNWTSQNAQNLAYLSSVSVLNPLFCPPAGTSGVYEYDVVIQNACGETTTKKVTIKYFASSVPNPSINITNNNLATLPAYPEISVVTTEFTEYVTYDVLDCNGNLLHTQTFSFFNQPLPPAPAQFKLNEFLDPCGCYKIRIRKKNYCNETVAEQILDWNRSQNLSDILIPNIRICKDGKRYICFQGKGIRQFELEIFNRWGQSMLQLNQSYNSEPYCFQIPDNWSDGVYFYIFKFIGCDGEIKFFNGTITVIGCNEQLLKMNDLDGDSLSITNLNSDSLLMVLSPNPAFDIINIDFIIPSEGQVKIKILDKNFNELFMAHNMYYANKGSYQITTQVQQIPAGINYCILEFTRNGTKKIFKRFTLIK